ncbi:MAG: M14 family metallopeptidase [Anaerolineales bacterium]
MSKTSGSEQGNILPWIVLLIWVLTFVLGAGLLVVIVAEVDIPGMLTPYPAVPDVPAAPILPALAEDDPDIGGNAATTMPEPPGTAPPDGPGAGPGRGGGGDLPGGVYVEPTFTPLFPVSPTPTFFITPVPPWEGPIVIGYSAAGRPLEVYRFGTGPVKRMIVAGIHGGYEWNTVALANELIAHLQARSEFVPKTVTLYILRALNPDGLARARGVDGRANENNVDLNRNFPVNWQKDWPRGGCWDYRKITGGPGPGSEPETQALMEFILDMHPTALISYHSAALGIFPGGEPWGPDSVRLAESLAAVSNYPYPPIDTGCLFSGTLPDFAVAHGIAAVDLELHTHKYTDFNENLKVLRAFLSWRR